MKRITLILVAIAALTITATVSAATTSDVVLKRSTTNTSVAAAYEIVEQVVEDIDGVHHVPVPYSMFGGWVTTTVPRQKVKLDLSLDCHKEVRGTDVETARRWTVKGKAPLNIWRAPPIMNADWCNVSFTGSRSFNARGRMVVTLLGRTTS
jgi:hypothetical protein